MDVLTATASEMQEYLQNRSLNSVDLVDIYLDQIHKHNHAGLNLCAVITTAPRELLLERAQALDTEREQTGIRDSMHGIPVIIKEDICSPSWAMGTTSCRL